MALAFNYKESVWRLPATTVNATLLFKKYDIKSNQMITDN